MLRAKSAECEYAIGAVAGWRRKGAMRRDEGIK
jgi:hypothetical protein